VTKQHLSEHRAHTAFKTVQLETELQTGLLQ